MDPKAFHTLSYGVYVVSSWDNGRPTGCTANCAAQITSSPATVMVSINKDNYTNKCIADCGHFSLSVLSENSDPSIIGTFGFRSGRDTDKFENVAWQVRDALPVLSDGGRAFDAAWWNLESDVSSSFCHPLRGGVGAATLRSPRAGLCAAGHCNGWLPDFHVRMVAAQPLFGV